MKLLTTVKKPKVLEASLELLHQQSREWLHKISFWIDEYDVFYILIITITDVPQKYKIKIDAKEKELFDRVLGNELKDLRKAIVQHENLLTQMLKSNHLDENSY